MRVRLHVACRTLHVVMQSATQHRRKAKQCKAKQSEPKRQPARPLARLTVSPEGEGVLSLPGLSPARSGVVVSMALAQTTGFLARRSEATRFAVL
jgi:hypothetical protein